MYLTIIIYYVFRINQEIVNLEDSSRQPKVTASGYNLYLIWEDS